MSEDFQNYVKFGLDKIAQEDRKVIYKEDYSPYQQAQNIIEDAKIRAKQMIEKAKADFLQKTKLARLEFEDKMKEERLKRMISLCKQSINYIRSLENKVPELVFSMVKKVIDEVPTKKVIANLVKKGIELQKNQEKLSVRVCPEEKEMIEAQIDKIIREFPNVKIVDVFADKRLIKGSCIVESPIGTVTTSVNNQLKMIEREFLSKV